MLRTPECTIFPLNPKAAQRYRERKAPSGTKSDHLDGWSFADAARLDWAHWRPLCRQDPLLDHLRLLCRDEVALIEERTALVNQLIAALHEYYPTALAAFEDWTLPSAWAFLEAFPTPQALARGGKRRSREIPAHPQAGPARNLPEAPGALRPGAGLSGLGGPHLSQEPPGPDARPPATGAAGAVGRLPGANREALCPTPRS
ncbi:MAG: transposase [Verrucomicrobia bacterium]|nr:transposase [Verrucomicrobiota bacterium]